MKQGTEKSLFLNRRGPKCKLDFLAFVIGKTHGLGLSAMRPGPTLNIERKVLKSDSLNSAFKFYMNP